jgi:hypothetical protein
MVYGLIDLRSCERESDSAPLAGFLSARPEPDSALASRLEKPIFPANPRVVVRSR